MEKFENILAPFIKEKGFDWEVKFNNFDNKNFFFK
jgi:hypothetical protein